MPTPTNQQIEQTRQVLGLKSFSEVSGLISNLANDVQWTAQLTDNTTFLSEQDSVNDVQAVGSIKLFGDNDISETLAGKIRNRSRLRFGLTALSGKATDADAEHSLLCESIESTVKWF